MFLRTSNLLLLLVATAPSGAAALFDCVVDFRQEAAGTYYAGDVMYDTACGPIQAVSSDPTTDDGSVNVTNEDGATFYKTGMTFPASSAVVTFGGEADITIVNPDDQSVTISDNHLVDPNELISVAIDNSHMPAGPDGEWSVTISDNHDVVDGYAVTVYVNGEPVAVTISDNHRPAVKALGFSN